MKKLLVLSVLCFIAISLFGQELPYSKLINLSDAELSQQKFKYNEDKNCWILKKVKMLKISLKEDDDLNNPDKDDYIITIQKGDNKQTAYIHVLFYNDETYHKLLGFANDKGESLKETNSVDLDKLRFKYDDKDIMLELRRKVVTNTNEKNSSHKRSVDSSYNIYGYTINTSVEPKSPYLDKQNKKKQDGQKKKSVNDLM